MAFNFNGQTTITNSQIGDNNIYYNELVINDIWKNIEDIFEQKANELKNDSYLCYFFNESKKYASNKNKNGLIIFFERYTKDFLKNVFYNISSTGIITLLDKIGIHI